LREEIQIGQVLDDRFEITGLVERTGMAAIFKAFDRHARQIVAIKVPRSEFEANLGSASRFAREAAIAGKLNHPGILKIIPVGKRSRPYVAMEYLEGKTLYDILDAAPTRRLPVCEGLRLGSRLCEILEYMHGQDAVHRDLKPGNIIISDDGSLHIIDFGVAKWRERELSGISAQMGTPEYMAPEQIRGDRTDRRTDLYSLGVILYEVMTGVRPFQGNTGDDIFNARLSGNPRPPRELNSEISEQVEEIILHAMAPNPSDRYSAAAIMKAELDAPERVQVSGKYRDPRQPSAWPKRFRIAGFVVSIAACPVVLFFLFLWMFQHR
jgi:eukaryotic-like serine/threonine-protein kinase